MPCETCTGQKVYAVRIAVTHLPAGKDGRRPTARSKGKVERLFWTVKEAHETLYHFHKPKTEEEANLWLRHFLERYNDKRHRREAHKKSAAEKRADSFAELAEKVSLSKEALSGKPDVAAAAAVLPFAQQPFVDPYRQFTYISRLDALRGVSDILQRPLARLDEEDLQFVNDLVAGTLDKAEIKSAVTARFKRRPT